ncbi:hypothetical protein BDA96_02G180000 [Sorghum bicolor]|uniref:Uncharacterized protein n=2 Tax=Sorghum bicolor TaxID=4558 RepID=A0A921RQS6_SORBI|nr:hypothetical protein BDA96_02G180000 [Sorghum bicolor]KXG35426.1 hypothetical protein SORBI_3002G171300 [Sorghum bicolor]
MRRWWPGRAHGQAGADCAPEIPFAVVREAKQDLSDIGDDVFVSSHHHLSFSILPFCVIVCSRLQAVLLDPLPLIFI